MRAAVNVSADAFVDHTGSDVSREIFCDEEIYLEESKQIFRRCWLYLGHESQVASPRDFFTSYMGEEPIIVTRDSEMKIHAFLNTCRHRGMRVCRADEGRSVAFTCTYHGWTYMNDGSLVGVPRFAEAYHEALNKADWGLVPVAQVDSYKGLIFGTFDPTAPPLRDYLGKMAWYLDCILDRREGGTEAIPGAHKWVVPANWKVGSDNLSGDLYHTGFTHNSQAQVFLPIRSRGGPETLQVMPEVGHGLVALLTEDTDAWLDSLPTQNPAVVAYYRSTMPEAEARLGPVRARMNFIAGNVFPNFGWIPGVLTIRVMHPRGPTKMEEWSWCITDKDAPIEVKDALRRGYLQRHGPSGILEQDDGENFGQVSASSRTPLARELPFDYTMGIGHERFHEDLPGQIGDGVGEMNQRGFYRRWTQEMNAGGAPSLKVDTLE